MLSPLLTAVIVLLFLLFPENTLNVSDKDKDLWHVARREFARRTREYVRRNPISDELRSYIEELKQSKKIKRENKDDILIIESGNTGTQQTVVNNLIDDKLKSTSESSQVEKVLQDVQQLISAQKIKKAASKDGALCNVNGYWDSETGGMTFHIKKTETKAEIQMSPREPPSEEGFIPLEKWNITAEIPFQQSAQVIITLTSSNARKVAIFLGECRICDGSETITGEWLVGRVSSGCKDLKAVHSVLADVLRKNNVETLREAHMKKISNSTIFTTSTLMPP